MGKSNKFDFSNRKNSGIDLGQSIGKSLVKEGEKLQKDAVKAAAKARKQSSSGGGGGSDGIAEAPNDAYSHFIDLQAPAKDLGDDGFCALADGLEVALKGGNAHASLALEDLNLAGNTLSTASLARLAPIIQLAKHDLKTVNLSNNDIIVATDEQAEQWELFLRSFGDCFKLRRLDLSDNCRLGDRAHEVFAKIYHSEPPVTPIPPGGDGSVLSFVSEHHREDQNIGGASEEDTGEDGSMASNVMANGGYLRRRCGLRAIPYITVQNTGLTDAGALWLSYILEEHHYPNQLTDELNATLASTNIKTYQQGGSSNGLDWSENKATLGKDGTFLLQKTETVRRQVLLDDQSTLAGSVVVDDPESNAGDGWHAGRMSKYARSLPGDRRTSIRSIRTTDGGEHEVSELESARKKIQRHVIDHDKVKSVDLWHAGLKLVAASRIICWAAPMSRKHYIGPSLFEPTAPTVRPSPTATHPASPTVPRTHPEQPLIDSRRVSADDTNVKKSYAAKLHVAPNVGEPEIAITEVNNTPTTPKVVFKPHRKGAFSEGLDLPAVTTKLSGLLNIPPDSSSPTRFITYQRHRMDTAPSGPTSYRDTSNTSHLPPTVIDAIVDFVRPANERGVLSEEQKRAAWGWGQQRATLRTELEWRKRDESFQVWMLLDGIRCLAYGQ